MATAALFDAAILTVAGDDRDTASMIALMHLCLPSGDDALPPKASIAMADMHALWEGDLKPRLPALHEALQQNPAALLDIPRVPSALQGVKDGLSRQSDAPVAKPDELAAAVALTIYPLMAYAHAS